QHHREMTTVALAAERMRHGRLERQAREHGDAVVALLAVERAIAVAKARKTFVREFVVRALRLLQAENVRANRFEEPRHQIDAKAHRIDVPGRDLDLHESEIGSRNSARTLISGFWFLNSAYCITRS